LPLYFLFSALSAQAQGPSSENPLLIHSNQPIAFDQVNAKVVREAAASVILLSDRRVKIITAIPDGKQTIANTLIAMDELYYDLGDLQSKLGVITSTYEDDSTRTVANDENDKLSLYSGNPDFKR